MKFILFFLLVMASVPSFAEAELTNESELGYASANGNSKTKSLNAKQTNEYKWDNNVVGLKSRYLNASAGSVETARYFMGGLRYENKVSQKLGIFIGETYEQDKFAGYQNRYSSDLGLKYRFIDSDNTKFFSELGYRYLHEERFDGSRAFSNYGRNYNEWENKWNESFSTKYWLEYLPNISDPNDWQANTELSLTVMMNKVFSLKTGVLVRYDHLPAPGVKYKSDTLFTTGLVAKF